VNSTSNADVPINDRRELVFQNQSISCSKGCKFEGLDNKNNTICDCINTNETKAFSNFEPLDPITGSNIDIIVCITTMDVN